MTTIKNHGLWVSTLTKALLLLLVNTCFDGINVPKTSQLLISSDLKNFTILAILANNTMASVAKSDWRLFIERVLWYNSPDGIAAEKIRQFYFGNYAPRLHPDPFETLDNYTIMISDRGFYYDAHNGALLQSKHSLVYMYYYSYRGEWSAVNYFKEIKGAWPRLVEVTVKLTYSHVCMILIDGI